MTALNLAKAKEAIDDQVAEKLKHERTKIAAVPTSESAEATEIGSQAAAAAKPTIPAVVSHPTAAAESTVTAIWRSDDATTTAVRCTAVRVSTTPSAFGVAAATAWPAEVTATCIAAPAGSPSDGPIAGQSATENRQRALVVDRSAQTSGPAAAGTTCTAKGEPVAQCQIHERQVACTRHLEQPEGCPGTGYRLARSSECDGAGDDQSSRSNWLGDRRCADRGVRECRQADRAALDRRVEHDGVRAGVGDLVIYPKYRIPQAPRPGVSQTRDREHCRGVPRFEGVELR